MSNNLWPFEYLMANTIYHGRDLCVARVSRLFHVSQFVVLTRLSASELIINIQPFLTIETFVMGI